MPVRFVSADAPIVQDSASVGVGAAGRRFLSSNLLRAILILAFIGYGIYRIAFLPRDLFKSPGAVAPAASGTIQSKVFVPFPGATLNADGRTWTVRILSYTPIPSRFLTSTSVVVRDSNAPVLVTAVYSRVVSAATQTPLGQNLTGLCVPPACVVISTPKP